MFKFFINDFVKKTNFAIIIIIEFIFIFINSINKYSDINIE